MLTLPAMILMKMLMLMMVRMMTVPTMMLRYVADDFKEGGVEGGEV